MRQGRKHGLPGKQPTGQEAVCTAKPPRASRQDGAQLVAACPLWRKFPGKCRRVVVWARGGRCLCDRGRLTGCEYAEAEVAIPMLGAGKVKINNRKFKDERRLPEFNCNLVNKHHS